jgi:hypothetical protein
LRITLNAATMASTQQKKKSLYLQRQIERREKFLQSQGAAQEPKHNVQIAPEVVNPPLRQTGHPARKNRSTKKTGPQQLQEKTLNPDNLQGVGVLLPSVSEKLPKPKAPQVSLSFHENTVSNKSALPRISKNVDDSHQHNTTNITASASPPAKNNPQPHCHPKPGALQGAQVSSSVREEEKGEPALSLSCMTKRTTQPHCSPKLGALPGEKVSFPIQEEGRREPAFSLTLSNKTNVATLCNESLLSPTSGKLDVDHQQKITHTTASSSPQAKMTTQPHSLQKLGATQGEQVSSPIQEEGEGHQASSFPLSHSMKTKPEDKNHGKNSKALSSSSPVNDIEPRRPSLQDQPCIQTFTELKEMDSPSPSHSPPEESQFSTLL